MPLRAALMLLFLALSASAAAEKAISPDWTLPDIDGETVRLSDAVSERPVVLLFWATWCPFCKALMPHLQSIGIEYGDSVDILALHFRDDGDPVAFVRGRGYDFRLLPEAGSVAELYGVHSTPGVVIVDGERMIRFNLYDLPRPNVPDAVRAEGRTAIAGFLAPYWAAEIRRRLDELL